MPKFRVTHTISYNRDVVVEAGDLDEAEEKADDLIDDLYFKKQLVSTMEKDIAADKDLEIETFDIVPLNDEGIPLSDEPIPEEEYENEEDDDEAEV